MESHRTESLFRLLKPFRPHTSLYQSPISLHSLHPSQLSPLPSHIPNSEPSLSSVPV